MTSQSRSAFLLFMLISISMFGDALQLKRSSADAASPSSGPPVMQFGAVACDVTATAIPASPMAGRNVVGLQNLGPNAIYVGTASVTTATGWKVAANGGTLSIDLAYDRSARSTLYCIAETAVQVSPNDTRWIEVR